MLLAISGLLALLPILGIGWMVVSQGWKAAFLTIDGLFTSLILLSISAILALNVPLLLRARKKRNGASTGTRTSLGTAAGGLIQKGKVESVLFFESSVGQPPKSLVSLADDSRGSNLLVFEGDLRNALPEGSNVEIAFRKQSGANILLRVDYS
jgi:hypothetical protein